MIAQTSIPQTADEFEAYVNAQIVNSLKVASVTLRVDEFKDVLEIKDGPGLRGTLHTMIVPYHPRVSNRDNSLHIKRGGATLRFEITKDDKDPDDYYPVGIAFSPIAGVTDAKGIARIGRLNFDQDKIRPKDHWIEITDSFKDLEGDDAYKFSVIIQRARDGSIGIIDPGIEHEPE